ncbi:hypothetical protein BDV23DRAFT_52549 [Aspergillus alliaceus]|uniref:Uncharacterized protein n=1 Tax=Petromyces alliaceus TaxID=209559 RepID=A0A5N7CES3_PETAA|nr:hypothetical protein BDV23DRAFT_52549 [Aspergillus alliaceus]
MPGDENASRHRHSSAENSQLWPDDDNPFVAFRRFADEQISSMLQSVTGLPSMVTAPPPDHWSVFEDGRYYNDKHIRQRQSGDGQQGDYSSESGTSATPESNHSTSSRSQWPESEDPWQAHRTRRQGPSHDHLDVDFFNSFFDKFWFDDRVSSRFFHPYNRPLFSSMVNDESPAWPVTYLMFSPYSPLHLERQAQYRSNRERGVFSSLMSTLNLSTEHDPAEPQWREAFEDLLRLENGKPMLDRELADASKRESGKDWLQGLVKRGSLGDRWKYISGTEGQQPWSTIAFDNSKNGRDEHGEEASRKDAKAEITWGNTEPESVTELDLYDRFLADIEAREREFFNGTYESPLLRILFEDRNRVPYNKEPSQGYRVDDTENWLDHASSEKQKTISATETHSTTNTSPAETNKLVTEQNPHVISTKTTTERIRLPDGSIQTKTIKTQRFADGREESNETIEVVNPPQVNRNSAGLEESASDQNPSGWFWKGN